MRRINGWIAAIALGAVTITGVTGCNTFRGAGKDIQKGGEAIENAAENTQEDMSSVQVYDHTITASARTGGTISPSGRTMATAGADRTFLVSANTGYHVADVLVDGRSVGAVSRHTFENVNGNHSISALFTPNASL